MKHPSNAITLKINKYHQFIKKYSHNFGSNTFQFYVDFGSLSIFKNPKSPLSVHADPKDSLMSGAITI